jgi:hypothetical protein
MNIKSDKLRANIEASQAWFSFNGVKCYRGMSGAKISDAVGPKVVNAVSDNTKDKYQQFQMLTACINESL